MQNIHAVLHWVYKNIIATPSFFILLLPGLLWWIILGNSFMAIGALLMWLLWKLRDIVFAIILMFSIPLV